MSDDNILSDEQFESNYGQPLEYLEVKNLVSLEDLPIANIQVDSGTDIGERIHTDYKQKKLSNSIIIPTDDLTVRMKLREVGQPIHIFAESNSERRKRLRDYFLERGTGLQFKKSVTFDNTLLNQVWYHEGCEELVEARYFFSQYSIERANARINKEIEQYKLSDAERTLKYQDIQKKLKNVTNTASQIGDSRPLSTCAVTPDDTGVITASRGGGLKLWDLSTCQELKSYQGHKDHIGGVTFHPFYRNSEITFATCCSDGIVNFYDIENDQPVYTLPKLENRVSRVAFHPSGDYLSVACFDKSWRLWDIRREMELIHQDGHSRECYTSCFHPDGSLLISAGFDARALVWDLRTGRCVLALDGHQKKITALDIASDGFHVATGSDDQTIMLWDLRKQQSIYKIPAHSSIITQVKFYRACLISGSFDGTAKVWTHPTWIQLASLNNNQQKVTGVDMTSDYKKIVTASFDRTFKVWETDCCL